MKAAVCYEFGKPLTIEDLELDPPQKGEIKVHLAAAAICHSDLHALKGEGSARVPFVAGHAAEQRDAERAVKKLTSGRGAAYVFVTVGSAAAVDQALPLTRKQGSVILVGMPAPGATASFQINALVRGEQRIMGSFMGSTRLRLSIPRLIDLYQHGRLKLDELITGRYPLERINEAIEAVEKGQALRNVIFFDFGKEKTSGGAYGCGADQS